MDDSIGSMPLNPTIANVFYRRGTIESWGSSIALLIHSCREQGLPEPKIDIVPNFVNLTIWFKDLLSTQDPTGLHKSDLTETERQIVDFFSSSENHRHRQLFPLDAESVAKTVQQLSEQNFRFSAPPLDGGHGPFSLLRRKAVHGLFFQIRLQLQRYLLGQQHRHSVSNLLVRIHSAFFTCRRLEEVVIRECL